MKLLITVTLLEQIPSGENLWFGSWTDSTSDDRGAQCYGRELKLQQLGQFYQEKNFIYQSPIFSPVVLIKPGCKG